LETAINLYQGGFKDEGTQLLKDLATKDPRNLDVLEISAQLFESVNNFSEANVYRKKIAVYDQFNAVNYLKMGKNYKALGDKINQEEMLVKILSFAPNTPEAATAKTELSS
jgi:tetratricopeptide (TPR) repeat protein